MVRVRIYVEGGGGGANPHLDTMLLKGFSNFWHKAGLKGRMPKTIAGGAGSTVFDKFCLALKNNKNDTSILLLDSEQAYGQAQTKWEFLFQRGNAWQKPEQANQNQLHFMIQSMEAWLLADRATLQKYYGSAFETNALPSEQKPLNTLSPQELETALKNATKNTSKGSYSKSKHSFELIGLIDPAKVMLACPSAKDLITHLLAIS